MTKITLDPMIVAASGKIGSASLLIQNGQQLLRSSALLPKRRSQAQADIRDSYSLCSSLWHQFYAIQRAAWDREAAKHKLSGWARFIQLVRAARQQGYDFVSSPLDSDVWRPDQYYMASHPAANAVAVWAYPTNPDTTLRRYIIAIEDGTNEWVRASIDVYDFVAPNKAIYGLSSDTLYHWYMAVHDTVTDRIGLSFYGQQSTTP